MKKELLFIVLFSVVFCGCFVGPEKYCDEPGVVGVYSCNAGVTKIVYDDPDYGFELKLPDGSRVSCPSIVPVEELPEFCITTIEQDVCEEKNLCQS
jgi:hypothetical protein